MPGLPRVSVILNAWNGEEFLAEALAGVKAQSMPDWELIVFDDASTDRTPGIIAERADARFRCLRSETRIPLGDARRAAIAAAGGEWLAFLDQDDVWHPRKLEWQLALAAEDVEGKVGLIYGRTLRFGDRIRSRDYDHRHEFRELPEGRILNDLFSDSCFIAMSSAMVRRTAYIGTGGVSPEFQTAFDYGLYAAICRDYLARAVQRPCCGYRVHGGNMTRASRIRVNEEALLAIDQCRADLLPRLVARRRRVHHTLIGVEEILGGSAVLGGMSRILTRGSILYLASRPMVRAGRYVRRILFRSRAAAVAAGDGDAGTPDGAAGL